MRHGAVRRGDGIGDLRDGAARQTGSLVVACAYILFLNPLHGAGGQSAVFYNLLTIGAASLTLRSCDDGEPRAIVRNAIGAMLLAGIAIQFKYTPVVEGMYFGAVSLWLIRRARMGVPAIAAAAAAMVATAMLPTLVAIGLYWHLGHLDAFVQANFLSVFARHPFPAETRIGQRIAIAVIAGPLLLVAAGKLADDLRRGSCDPRYWIGLGWVGAALAGFGMLGDFYDFYFITVLPPLLLFVASVPSQSGASRIAAIATLLWWPFLLGSPQAGVTGYSRDATSRLAQAIAPYVHRRTLPLRL